MNKTLLALASSLVIAALPQLALAQTAAPAAPAEPEASPLSFNVSITTDYRYRGISQSRLKPAIQGGVDYALPGGFYVGAWASSIKWIKDAGGGASAEVDLYGGYKGEITKDLTYDVGVLTYQYPKNDLATSANTTEIYGALTYGPATLKYSHSLTNLFGFADSKNSGYVDLSATFEVGPAVQVIPHVGYQKIAGGANSDFSYTDYSLTLGKDFSGFFVSVTAVGTSTKSVSGNAGGYAYPAPDGKNLGRADLVLAVKKTF